MSNLPQIPDFLLEMSEQLNTQDNRSTAEPIYQVRYKQSVTAAAGREEYKEYLLSMGGDYFDWDEGSGIDPLIDLIKDDYPECLSEFLALNDWDSVDDARGFDPNYSDPEDVEFPDPLDWELELIGMQKIEVVVKSCLTQADAEYFIQRKQHDYKKLYIYVESMVFCPQMIELRNWIKSLTVAQEVAA